MHRLRVALIAFALITAGCSKNPTVHFGAIEGDRVRDTTRIEHRLGNKYGYRIDFAKRMGIVRLREEFSLPAAAEWKRNTDALSR